MTPPPPATGDGSPPGRPGSNTQKIDHRINNGGKHQPWQPPNDPPPTNGNSSRGRQGRTNTRVGEEPPHQTGHAAGTGEGPPAPHKKATHPSQDNTSRQTRTTHNRQLTGETQTSPQATQADQEWLGTEETLPTRSSHKSDREGGGYSPTRTRTRNASPSQERRDRSDIPTLIPTTNPATRIKTDAPRTPTKTGEIKAQPTATRTNRKPRSGTEEGRPTPKPEHTPNPNPKPRNAGGGRAPNPSTRASQQ